MSNNLGQIYATSKGVERYIILDSQNVEVSGNFLINGTNSRMPAELENSIRNYLPLTYGTTDPNPNTLYHVISEVSNNLLISNNDASFNNVDISGTLDISNNKTYNDLSNNNNAVLNLGQIREYNAINTYVLLIKQTQAQTGITHNATNTELDHLIADSFSGYTDYTSDFTSNKWYPSIPGLYIHYSHVTVASPSSGDTLKRAYTNLRKSGTNIHRSFAMLGSNEGDDFEKITLTMHQIIHVTQADITNNVYYDITMYVYLSSGNANTQAFNGKDTYITIHKIG